MNTTTFRRTSRIVAGCLLPAILSMSTAQAAQLVAWKDLRAKVGTDIHHEYRVITKTGARFGPGNIEITAEGINLSTGDTVPRAQVAEIRIHHVKKWSDAMAAPGVAMVESSGENIELAVFLLPVLIITTIAAVPVTLSVEGIRRLLPDKVIKVAP